MLGWEMGLFHIKARVSILQHIVKSDPLMPKDHLCRKLLLEDPLASDKISAGLIPRINGVVSKRNTTAIVTFPEDISILDFSDALILDLSTLQVDKSASLDLQTSQSNPSWILCQKIYRATSITHTIQQDNNLDPVVVQTERCVKKWH